MYFNSTISDATKLLKPVLVFAFAMAAGVCGLTQITQHRSHAVDVYAGFLIGAGIAAYLVSCRGAGGPALRGGRSTSCQGEAAPVCPGVLGTTCTGTRTCIPGSLVPRQVRHRPGRHWQEAHAPCVLPGLPRGGQLPGPTR